eukprot:CAMPEP_0194270262 /NCGR_PEP_ID=MMETSP0169-20130528/4282_1 /TAXON_ID=218684 /ORGANISM="Corethron pennatum, Strain L29A3" /LENGTH=341 /DNA_ID=CAMNT_0039012243 /DNA_START=316 /DNA_END=1337 /DNA_ORIENTATION=-
MSRNEDKLPDPVDSLDLHNYQRDRAIAQVTFFLSKIASSKQKTNCGHRCVWVRIVTGSGNHSTNGPQLRDAVKALLIKRQMEFRLCRGGGAFMVRVDSGMELYEAPPPTDTKLTFKIDHANYRATHGPCRPQHPSTIPLNAQNGLALHWSDLTPAQQDAEEKALAEARIRRDRTVRDRRAVTKAHDEEELVETLNQIGNLGELRRCLQDEDFVTALKLSKDENHSRDLVLKEEEDARQLREAIQISKDEELFHIQEEEESLRFAIMESMNACKVAENKKEVEDKELQMILALSENDAVMYEDFSQDSYETMLREAKEESEQIERENFAKDEKENKLLLEML